MAVEWFSISENGQGRIQMDNNIYVSHVIWSCKYCIRYTNRWRHIEGNLCFFTLLFSQHIPCTHYCNATLNRGRTWFIEIAKNVCLQYIQICHQEQINPFAPIYQLIIINLWLEISMCDFGRSIPQGVGSLNCIETFRWADSLMTHYRIDHRRSRLHPAEWMTYNNLLIDKLNNNAGRQSSLYM